MAFAFGLRGEWPNSPIVAGLAFLILGVVLGVRATRRDT
jgi:drug/metabolite transporter (DMT)-like permease